ncbi:MAG: hypothetical protein JWP97_1179 [Labilithrix sp.]|nr:hypothetical protein [Labilithrix sp.]
MASESSSRLFREIFIAGFMAGLPAENVRWAAARLAPNMTDVRLAAGEVLYRPGDPPDAHWFVVSGAIRLEAEGHPSWVLGERSLVGTMDISLDRPRTRTAIAERNSFLLRLPAGDWLDMLEDNFQLTQRALEGLGEFVNATRVELDPFTYDADGGPNAPIPEGPLGFVDRVLLLRSLPLFRGGEMQALANLAELAHVRQLAPGEVLVERGRAAPMLAVVLAGEVDAQREDRRRAQHYGPGTLVFGGAAVAGRDLGYEVRATAATRILEIGREDFLDVLEEHFQLARSVLRGLVAEREVLVDEKERRAAAKKA